MSFTHANDASLPDALRYSLAGRRSGGHDPRSSCRASDPGSTFLAIYNFCMIATHCDIRGAGLGIVAALLAGLASAEDGRKVSQPGAEGPFRVEMTRVIDGWRFNLRWHEGPSSRSDGRYHLANVHTPSATASDPPCEREIGIAVRDFVRAYVRGKQLKTRDVREGREPDTFVGRLEVDDEDLSAVLLEMGVAVPYYDDRWNPELRRWDCARNRDVWRALKDAGMAVPEQPDEPPDETGPSPDEGRIENA